MREIEIFVPQSGEIAVVQRVFLISFGNGVQLQQSGLPQEDGFYLEEVVAMMVYGSQRQMVSPLLERVAVDSEPVVARQGHEVGVLPIAVTLLYARLYCIGFLRKALGLQGAHPTVHGEAGERWDNLVAGRILVDAQQFLIMFRYVFGDVELQLHEGLAFRVLGFYIDGSANVQDDVVVAFILIMSVHIPVACLVVNLHVSHP